MKELFKMARQEEFKDRYGKINKDAYATTRFARVEAKVEEVKKQIEHVNKSLSGGPKLG